MNHDPIVVMGVSGCGKSTVGVLLAEALGARFIDGDDLHSESNKAKMASGTPLNDDDRWPWLDLVAQKLTPDTVIACSSLKRVYRDRIRATSPNTVFVHLSGSREVLLERMNSRQGHFFKPQMLDSQLAILEALAADERGMVIDIAKDVDAIVQQVVEGLSL